MKDANNDSIHAKAGPGHERRRYGIARATFGPRVALALKQAGVFQDVTLDDLPSVAQTGR